MWEALSILQKSLLCCRNDSVSRAYVGRLVLCAVIYCHKELSEQVGNHQIVSAAVLAFDQHRTSCRVLLESMQLIRFYRCVACSL